MANVKIDKASWELTEVVKETIKKNVVGAVSSKQISIENDTLQTLFKLIDTSTSEAYNKSYKNFSNKFEKISNELSSELTTQTTNLKKRK